jgi:hypothetical protein
MGKKRIVFIFQRLDQGPEIRSKNIMTAFTAHQHDERRTDKI